ncbi:hypothetical protein AVEN_129504-1 [Araneus ventricosus]|uniref:Mos1 transposase HTH domain-containing protein n=1 Tax=Araneus ventricosus TaxID=182803 RepID=A0A4Y2PP24_ARAVE|nr:hypothetical protein AVEN_129504-1 [Araneus ventricosus]
MAIVPVECRLEEQRRVVRFLCAKGLSAKDIHKEMLSVYSENCFYRQAVYCNIVSKLRDAIRRKRPGLLARGIVFHHDNAKLYTARLTEEKTEELW